MDVYPVPAPPAVSATWFPPEERVTATSIGQMFNGLGAGLGFLIARLFVPTQEEPGHTGAVRAANLSVAGGEKFPHLTREIHHYLLFLAAPPLGREVVQITVAEYPGIFPGLFFLED